MRILFSCVVCVLPICLSGCFTRDSKVLAGQEHAQAAVRNYAKNQRLAHTAEQSAFALESKAHIDTKYEWSMEGVQRKAEADKAITPAAIVTEAKRLTYKRDQLRDTVDAKVSAIRKILELSERDLFNAARLQGAVSRYDNEEGFNLESLTQAFGGGAPAPTIEPEK